MSNRRIVQLVLIILLCQGCRQSEKSELTTDSTGILLPTNPSLESNADADYVKKLPYKRNSVQDSLIDAIRYLKDTALIKILVKRGADVNKKDEHLFYPLYWAQYEYQNRYREPRDSGVINTLLELGAVDHNAQLSILFDLCKRGNLDSVRLLIVQGLDVNARIIWYDPEEEDAECYCYETPISASVRSGNLALVQFLLDRGAQINLDMNGVQPLAVALKERQYAIASLLIENKAEKKYTFALGEPFYRYGAEDTVYLDYLIRNHFSYEPFYGVESPLQKAASNGNISVLRRLIPITTIEERNSALCCSTTLAGGNILLKNGAEINSVHSYFGEGGCNYFRTPLCTAVQMGNLTYIKFLIESGADVNFLDTYMKDYADKEEYFRCNVKSPLTMAILEEKPDVTRFLIDQGANVNFIIQEPFEKTFISPLIAAVQKNDVYLTKLLLEKGAKVVINNVSVDHYVTGSTSRVIVEALNQAK